MPTKMEMATARLDSRAVELLGDTIAYATGQYEPTIEAFAFVDFIEADINGAIAQQMTVELFDIHVPARPDSNCRIRLSAEPDRLWAPVNVRRNRTGTGWQLDLKEIRA